MGQYNGCSLNDIHIDKQISKSSICKVLKQNKITRKKANIRIVAKNVEKIKLDRINFVNDYKNYGYFKKGVEIKKIKKHKKTQERRTVLSCINIKYTNIKLQKRIVFYNNHK